MTRCPIVFLDIDGVLVRLTIEHYRHGTLDADCVRALNALTDATGAEIVISSSWRITNDWEGLISTLHESGVKAPIIGRTPLPRWQAVGTIVPCKTRGQEIDEWLRRNGPHLFVILDDAGDMVVGSPGRRRVRWPRRTRSPWLRWNGLCRS